MLAEKEPKQVNSSHKKSPNDMLSLQAIALEASATAIAITDAECVIQWVNSAFTHLTGYSADEAIGQNPWSMQRDTHDPAFYDEILQTLSDGDVWQGELTSCKKDGTHYFEEMTITPVSAAGNGITNHVATKVDISSRKEAEAALNANEAIIRSALDAVVTIDVDGFILDWSGRSEKMFGWSSSEAVGKPLSDVIVPIRHREAHAKGLKRFRETSKGRAVNRQIEIDALHRDGHEFPIEMALFSVELEDSVKFSAFIKDITYRKEAEHNLKQAESLSQTMLEAITLPLLVSRISDGTVLYANRQVSELFELQEEEVVGKQTPDFYQNPNDRLEILQAIKEHGGVDNYKLPVNRLNGEPLWIMLSNRRINYGGEAAIITTLVDITAQKKAEDALAVRAAELETVSRVSASAATILETEKLLQEVVDLTKDRFALYHAHIYLLNSDDETLVLAAGAGETGKLMVAEERIIPLHKEQSLVAQAARTKQGVIENDVRNNPAFLPHPLLPDTRAEMAVPMLVGEQVVGVLDVQADDVDHFTQQDVVVKSTLAAQIGVALQNARSYTQVQVALAESKRSQEAIQERETLMRTIIDSTPDWIFVVDVNHRYLLVNQAYAGSFNMEPEAVVGKNALELGIPEDIVKGNPEKGIIGFWPDDQEVINSGEMKIVDIEPAVVDGEDAYISTIKSPLKNVDGEVTAVVGFVHNITNRIQIEEGAKKQAERLATLNEMSTELNQTDSLEAVYRVVGQYTQQIVGGDRASLTLVDPDGETFSISGLSGEKGLVPLNMHLPIEGTAVGLSIQTQSSKRFPQDGALNQFLDTRDLTKAGIQATIVSPLFVDGTVVGTLNIASKSLNAFGSQESSLMQQVTNLVSSTLQIHNFLEATRKQAEELQVALGITEQQAERFARLNEMSASLNQTNSLDDIYHVVGLYTQKILSGDRASLALVDPNRETFAISGLSGEKGVIPLDTHLPIKGTGVGKVISTGKLHRFPQDGELEQYMDTSQMAKVGMQSMINSPIVVNGEVIGSLNIATKVPDAYGPQEVMIMQQVTNLVSSTLQIRNFLEATERQAQELQTVADISATVTMALGQEKLLQEMIDLTTERFNLYHGHIYLLNASGETLVMAVGAGDVGRELVTHGHHIDLNAAQSLVAQTARTQKAVVVNDVRSEPNWLANELLPDTRSEMAVPMILGGQVIGVLDVQSDEVNRFSDQDVQIQTTLAAQMAVALQNARSYEQAQTAVSEMNALTRRLTREGWQEYLAEKTADKVGFVYNPAELNPIAPLVEAEPNGVNTPEQTPDVSSNEQLIRSISVLGESIGQISIVPDDGESDADSELDEIMNAVTQRLSDHLENLRLSEQTQTALSQTEQQAERLSMLNEMGAELSRADMLDEILEIGVNHTAKILVADRVTLGILTPEREHIEFVAAWGEDEMVESGVIIPIGMNKTMKTAVRENRVILEQKITLQTFDDMKSFMTAPLAGDNRVIGVINVGNLQPDFFTKQDQSLILQISSLLGAAIERQRLAELTKAALDETQKRSEELALINRVMAAVTGSLDLTKNMQIIARELAQAISVSHVGIALVTEDQNYLEVVTEYPLPEAGSPQDSIGQLLPIKGNPLTEQALETRKFAVAYDAQNNPLTAPIHDLMRQRQIATLAVLPMAMGDEIFGTVGFDLLDPDRMITDEQMRLAETIVYHTTTVVQNARLFAQTEQRLADLMVIQQTVSDLTEAQSTKDALESLTPKLMSAVDADSVTIFEIQDEQLNRLIQYPELSSDFMAATQHLPLANFDISQEALRTRRPIVISTNTPELAPQNLAYMNAAEIVSTALVPLVSQDGVVGLMLANMHQEGKRFSEHDTGLLQTLANQASIALDRIRLLEETRLRARREQLLREIAAKVRSSTQVDGVMRTAVQEVGRALGRKTFLYLDQSANQEQNPEKDA